MKLEVNKRDEQFLIGAEWMTPAGSEDVEFDNYLDVMVWINDNVTLGAHDLWYQFDDRNFLLNCLDRTTNIYWVYRIR